MPSLRKRYGVASGDLLEAIDLLPHCKSIFERSVVETHMRRLLLEKVDSSVSELEVYERRNSITWLIWVNGLDQPIRAECKIARRRSFFAEDGTRVVGHFVSVHSSGDSFEFSENRLSGPDPFHIVGVCMGRITSKWSEFLFAKTIDLQRHDQFPNKLAPLHQLPDATNESITPWYRDIAEVLSGIGKNP